MDVIIFSYLIGVVPLIFICRKDYGKYGRQFFIFSPSVLFFFGYTFAFLFRPYFRITENLHYENSVFIEDLFMYSLLVAAIANYSFALGYLFSVKKTNKHSSDSGINGLHYINRFKIEKFTIFIVQIFIFFSMLYFLYDANALTFSLGENRRSYLSYLNGKGYVNYLNGTYIFFSIYIILKNKFYHIRTKSREYILIVLWFLLNIIVTNRSVVTIVLFLFLFISILNKKYFLNQTKGLLLKLLPKIFIVLFMGIVLGLLRGVEGDSVDSHIAEQLKRGLLFFSATFDMSESFLESIRLVSDFYYGQSWLEDIIFTSLPRIIFPLKPIVYGTTWLQTIVYPTMSSTSGGFFSATYPVGIYGESYINFGYIGVLAILFILGVILRKLFDGIIINIYSKRIDLVFINLYIYFFIAGNTLGYLRSFGGFLAALFFSILTIKLQLIFIRYLAQFFQICLQKGD